VAGHQLIIAHNVVGNPQQAITSVTGGEAAGYAWTQIVATTQNGFNFQDTEVWWLPKSAGGNVTVTVTYTGGLYGAGAGLWFAEALGLTGLDGAAVITTGTSTTATATTGTPSAPGDFALVVCCGINFSQVAPYDITGYPATPWTNDDGPSQLSAFVFPNATQRLAGTSSVSASWTGGSCAWAALGILFTTGPTALALTEGATGAQNAASGLYGEQISTTGAPQNVTSISLAAGHTFVVTGVCIEGGGSTSAVPYLNSASAVAINSWPAQTISGVATTSVSAVITTTAITTVYLNISSPAAGQVVSGQIFATRIE